MCYIDVNGDGELSLLPSLFLLFCSATILLFFFYQDDGLAPRRIAKSRQVKEKQRAPPIVPYCILFLGSIPWKFLWDPIQFLSTSS